MHSLFSPKGEAALAALLRAPVLLAFDFDGTLSPIVARAEDARITPIAQARLAALAARLPVAIVTGRAVADVQPRLGFAPRFIVGNHGAEGGVAPARMAALAHALDPLREALRPLAAAWQAAGITLEDKGLSLALHHRLAPDQPLALALIDAALAPLAGTLHVFAGKRVVNVAAAGAPDKADAVTALVAQCGAAGALFAGDDVNDEPVFAAAPPHWVTVKVGRDGPPTQARFVVDGPADIERLLARLLALSEP